MNVRDMSLIYSSLFMCVGALLFIVATGLLAMIAFLIRDHIVPAIDKLDDTAKTVRGTATFVSESVVAPIIKVAGAAAGAKAMVQTLMRRNPPRPSKPRMLSRRRTTVDDIFTAECAETLGITQYANTQYRHRSFG